MEYAPRFPGKEATQCEQTFSQTEEAPATKRFSLRSFQSRAAIHASWEDQPARHSLSTRLNTPESGGRDASWLIRYPQMHKASFGWIS